MVRFLLDAAECVILLRALNCAKLEALDFVDREAIEHLIVVIKEAIAQQSEEK